MDPTGQSTHDLPTASLSREPLSYSSEITSDMPWLLRFVGCFIILHSLTPLLNLVIRLLRFDFGPAGYVEQLRMLGMVLAVLAGLGVCMRRRWPFALTMVLCLCNGLEYLAYDPLPGYGAIWLWQLPVSVTQILLLGAIYRRANRSGVLLPDRTDNPLPAPSGDDILWFCRCMGSYLLVSSAVTLYYLSRIWLTRDTPNSPWQACPTLHTSMILLTAAEITLAMGIVLRRYRLLAVCAALAALAPLVRDLAGRLDLARNPAYPGMPKGIQWQYLLLFEVLGILTAAFYLALYRKARGRAEGATASRDSGSTTQTPAASRS